MKKNNATTISEYPIPDSLSTEMQVIADIVAFPETLIEAERLITPQMFTDEKCREAYETLRAMAKEGMVIDLPSTFGKVDKDLMTKGVIPMMNNTATGLSAIQHYSMLRDFDLNRKCYYKAVELLMNVSQTTRNSQELIGWAGNFAESLRAGADMGNGIQHISQVLNDLGSQVEERMKERESGKVLRVPTGFYSLDYLTFGGFNAGNLVILAGRPSVGKTAIMLQMVRAAASAGKTVNFYNLEMTNTEMAQRFLYATERITPAQMARADVDWQSFEVASGQFASKPIYLSDTIFSEDEIIANITLNAQSGKCDIVFIDYLGLVMFSDTKAQQYMAIAGFTKRLKKLAKTCKVPIVLLCQLNRLSASEKRSPQLYDLRDSGSIEQDADIVLMLERASGTLDDNEVYMWVRKNRQGKAGEVKVEIVGNETFTAFTDKNAPTPPPMSSQSWVSDFDNDNDDIPF
jgi:replicative DNA helicase